VLRTNVLGLIASASTIVVLNTHSPMRSTISISNGKALLVAKIKQNGKHEIYTAGKADVFAEVSNGKVVGDRRHDLDRLGFQELRPAAHIAISSES